MFGRIVARRFSTARTMRVHFDQEGRPGANMPFGSSNKLKWTIGYALFCSSALSAPFLMVRHQLLHK